MTTPLTGIRVVAIDSMPATGRVCRTDVAADGRHSFELTGGPA